MAISVIFFQIITVEMFWWGPMKRIANLSNMNFRAYRTSGYMRGASLKKGSVFIPAESLQVFGLTPRTFLDHLLEAHIGLLYQGE
jgi:hypothetical protein